MDQVAGPIYLDNAATTRMLPEVADWMREVQLAHFGNPSSSHSFGSMPRRLLEDAREFLRGALGAGRLVLTSGGSEADLLGVLGAALARAPGRILVGAADHPAVLAQAPLLARLGHRLELVPVNPHGVLDVTTLQGHLDADVRVVAILHGHNELGTLADLTTLLPAIRSASPDAHVHLDLVQSFGKVDVDFDASGADSAAISAHKFHGPRGVGALLVSNSARLEPLQPAGGQEQGHRGGTENVAGAAAMARAAEIVLADLAQQRAHAERLAQILCERISAEFPTARRLGDPAARLPQIVSMQIPGVQGHTLQTACAAAGLAFSTGSACHGDDHTANHVLQAIGLAQRAAREVVRFSFARDTTEDEVRHGCGVLIRTAHGLQAQAPRRPRDTEESRR